jgi:hypothetical protein
MTDEQTLRCDPTRNPCILPRRYILKPTWKPRRGYDHHPAGGGGGGDSFCISHCIFVVMMLHDGYDYPFDTLENHQIQLDILIESNGG